MKIINKYYLQLFIPLLTIMIISFFNMYSVSKISFYYNHHLIKQILWYIIGFLIIIIAIKLNLKSIFKYSKYFYILSIILLILVLFLGKEINGARAWFSFSFFSFQPSELVKLTLPIYLINIVSNNKNELFTILKTIIITLIPSILVFLEPDTGAIIFYIIILFSILIFSDINKKWFIILFVIISFILISFILLYFLNQDLLIELIGTSIFYRIDRIISFTNNNSYQLKNALITIGNASLFGNKKSIYIP